MLFCFSLYLCFSSFKPGTPMHEMFKMRYLFLLMGFFSTYCGFIYNDMTSIPLTILGESCYEHSGHAIIQKEDCVY